MSSAIFPSGMETSSLKNWFFFIKRLPVHETLFDALLKILLFYQHEHNALHVERAGC
jgi:hypothetical protein